MHNVHWKGQREFLSQKNMSKIKVFIKTLCSYKKKNVSGFLRIRRFNSYFCLIVYKPLCRHLQPNNNTNTSTMRFFLFSAFFLTQFNGQIQPCIDQTLQGHQVPKNTFHNQPSVGRSIVFVLTIASTVAAV